MDQDEDDPGESYGSVKLDTVEDYLEDRPDLIFIQCLDNYIDRSHPTTTSAASQVIPPSSAATAAVQRPQEPGNSSALVPAKLPKLSRCCVVGCPNSNSDSMEDPVQMFLIPSDINRRLKWLKNLWIGQPKFIPRDHSQVCHLHFRKTAFTDATKNLAAGRELKPSAWPVVFPWSKLPARRKPYMRRNLGTTPANANVILPEATADVPVDHNTAGGSCVKLHRPLTTVKREAVSDFETTPVDEIAGENSVKVHRPLQVTMTTVKREPVPLEAPTDRTVKLKAVPTTKSTPVPKLPPKLPVKCETTHGISASVNAAATAASSGNSVKLHVTSTCEAAAPPPPEVPIDEKSVKFNEYMGKLSTCTVAIKECLLELEDISTMLGNRDYLPKHLTDELEGCTSYIEDSTIELESIARALSDCMVKSGGNPIQEENSIQDEDAMEEDLIQEDVAIQEESQIEEEEETVKVKTEMVDEEQEEIQQEELHIKEEEISDDDQFGMQHDEIQIKEEEGEYGAVPKKRAKVIGFSFKNGQSFDDEPNFDNADDVEPVVIKQLHNRQNRLGTDKPVVIDDDKINVLLEHSYAMSWVGGYDGQPEGGWIKCDVCMYRCRNQDRMNTHFQENHVSKQCPQCSFTANSLVLIRKHVAREHPFPSGDGTKCPHCTFTASSQSEMRLHIKSRHSDVRGWPGRNTVKTPKRARIIQVEQSVEAGSSTSLTSK